jgi:tripartite-type tricarboxylate transporter receptor subunit TctC
MAVAPAFAGAAFAQQFPTRPVRVVVPLAAGGGMDAVSRALSVKLGEAFNHTFVVDNRPGAGSQIALDIMASAAPDGHTLMMVSATTVVHPLLYTSRYDIVRDFSPVSQVTSQGYVLVLHPSISSRTVGDFVQYLRANPYKVNYSSSGIGSLVHMSAELFNVATSTRMTHIPYKGMGAAYSDLLGGHVQCAFPTIISSIAHINSGKLRALAVTTGRRVVALPGVPTFSETGVKGMVVVNWYGLIAPAKTPLALVSRVASEAAKAMRAPEMIKTMSADGAETVGSAPAEFAAHIKTEHELWARVVKAAGIKGN